MGLSSLHFILFSKGKDVRPRWFLVSSLAGMCMTLMRKQVVDLFSRQNKLAVCIFAV